MSARILVICGDQYHPANDVLGGLRAACGQDADFVPAPEGPVTEFGGFDGVVLAKMNVCSTLDTTPWANTEADTALGEFVAAGKRLLVVHAGTVGYPAVSAIREMTGGAFIQHPEPCKVTLTGLGIEPLTVFDEHYFIEIDPDIDVFMESTSIHGSQPAGWTRTHGRGRVSALTPGHFAAIWSSPDFQALLRRVFKPL